ncbi:MAG: hypothetical protein H7138_11670, partial [Myxococcales bacterium]|nr:hypothetical protein [Myxococcales bacterium]
MSTVAHVVVGVGLFTTSVWQLQQLDRPRSRLELGSQPPPPPPPPAGGPVAANAPPEIIRKPPKIKVNAIVQPPVVKPDEPDVP